MGKNESGQSGLSGKNFCLTKMSREKKRHFCPGVQFVTDGRDANPPKISNEQKHAGVNSVFAEYGVFSQRTPLVLGQFAQCLGAGCSGAQCLDAQSPTRRGRRGRRRM